MNIEYDGSFAGFLSLASKILGGSLVTGPVLSIQKSGCAEQSLFDEPCYIETDTEAARSFYAKLRAILGDRDSQGLDPFGNIRAAFASDREGIELPLLEYIRVALAEGRAVLDHAAESWALAVEKASHRSCAEAHLHLGIIRFSELADGSLYSEIEPDCDILPMMSKHFSERFPGFRWVIRDLRRDAALLHEKNKPASIVRELKLDAKEKSLWSETEPHVREAWQRYFHSVSIKERKNPALQANHVPKKRWKHMSEMERKEGERPYAKK